MMRFGRLQILQCIQNCFGSLVLVIVPLSIGIHQSCFQSLIPIPE